MLDRCWSTGRVCVLLPQLSLDLDWCRPTIEGNGTFLKRANRRRTGLRCVRFEGVCRRDAAVEPPGMDSRRPAGRMRRGTSALRRVAASNDCQPSGRRAQVCQEPLVTSVSKPFYCRASTAIKGPSLMLRQPPWGTANAAQPVMASRPRRCRGWGLAPWRKRSNLDVMERLSRQKPLQKTESSYI